MSSFEHPEKTHKTNVGSQKRVSETRIRDSPDVEDLREYPNSIPRIELKLDANLSPNSSDKKKRKNIFS